MAKTCELCGKGKTMGNTRKLLRGHYNITGRRTFRPNLQRIKNNGEYQLACVNCIRTINKEAKAEPQTK